MKEQDLFLLLMMTVRYALGRKTYITGFCKEALMNYGDQLTKIHLEAIKSEIEYELKRAEKQKKFVGMAVDHLEWKKAVHCIDLLLKEKKNDR